MFHTPHRAAILRVVGTLVVLMLYCYAPTTCEASCGDYLHYGQTHPESKPIPAPSPCDCRGAECSPHSESPLAPVPIPSTLFDEFATPIDSTEIDPARTRFGHPTSSDDAPGYCPFPIDPPPRSDGMTARRSETSLLLRGGSDGSVDLAVARVQAGDGSR